MATKKYEVKSPIRLEDGELIPIGEVKSLEEQDEDTQTFLARGVVVLVPGQEDDSAGDEGTGPTPSQSANVPAGQGSGDNGGDGGDDEGGGAASPDGDLVEVVGEDMAETLTGGGITTLAQATAATNEDLDAIQGVGKKTIEKIRAAG